MSVKSENKQSYCSIHETYPMDGEPCWQCVNKAIEEYIKLEEKLEKTPTFGELDKE